MKGGGGGAVRKREGESRALNKGVDQEEDRMGIKDGKGRGVRTAEVKGTDNYTPRLLFQTASPSPAPAARPARQTRAEP